MLNRRRFLFASAGIVASTSLMKISTAFATDTMTYKAVEVMPDLGPMTRRMIPTKVMS